MCSLEMCVARVTVESTRRSRRRDDSDKGGARAIASIHRAHSRCSGRQRCLSVAFAFLDGGMQIRGVDSDLELVAVEQGNSERKQK
jgi:hypothetical protein